MHAHTDQNGTSNAFRKRTPLPRADAIVSAAGGGRKHREDSIGCQHPGSPDADRKLSAPAQGRLLIAFPVESNRVRAPEPSELRVREARVTPLEPSSAIPGLPSGVTSKPIRLPPVSPSRMVGAPSLATTNEARSLPE